MANKAGSIVQPPLAPRLESPGLDGCWHYPKLHKSFPTGTFPTRLPAIRNLLSPLSSTNDHHRSSPMIVDRSQTIMHFGLSQRWDHQLLPFRAPHLAQSRQPTDIELIRIVKDFVSLHPISSFINRLFLIWYSGSGLEIVCCGRLNAISSFANSRRIVSSETRMPVFSAR